MTTYNYRLVLNDSEVSMLRAALEMMIHHCEEKLADKPEAPFYAHRDSAHKILSRLYDDTEMTSTNNFK